MYDKLPKEGFTECILCGTKTKGTAFCKNCWQEYDDEELLNILNNQKNNKEYDYCVVCGAPSNGYPQCKECYHETKEYMSSFDKHTTHESRTYYYNLKDYIYRLFNNIESVMTNCNKLIAIAINNEVNNGDSALLDRAYKDVESIIENKNEYFKKRDEKNKDIKNQEDIIEQEDKKEQDNPILFFAEDGHGMESDAEVNIDNILYSSEILHCVHRPITEITEKNKICDWFIPIDSINNGIYIEYWGMKTTKYLKDRKEKEELYKKHNIPYISIEKDEYKDTQSFKANLIREITRVAEKHFGKMPKWKK